MNINHKTINQMNINQMNIKPSQLENNLNYCIGDLLEGPDGGQYVIEDYSGPYIVLRLLTDDERVKPEFINGRFR